jgi:hypothetical protein
MRKKLIEVALPLDAINKARATTGLRRNQRELRLRRVAGEGEGTR